MNAKSRKNLFVAIAVSLTAVSCSLGGKDYAMTSMTIIPPLLSRRMFMAGWTERT